MQVQFPNCKTSLFVPLPNTDRRMKIKYTVDTANFTEHKVQTYSQENRNTALFFRKLYFFVLKNRLGISH